MTQRAALLGLTQRAALLGRLTRAAGESARSCCATISAEPPLKPTGILHPNGYMAAFLGRSSERGRKGDLGDARASGVPATPQSC